ncbi:MAG: helix-turn-helix domain-containing protein [[Ruminococcus] lactaris]
MMNREELAASLNAARPSLSRELSQMQDEGIIKMEGRKSIKILDYSRLQEDLADVSD